MGFFTPFSNPPQRLETLVFAFLGVVPNLLYLIVFI
jgi:hypothetical protein